MRPTSADLIDAFKRSNQRLFVQPYKFRIYTYTICLLKNSKFYLPNMKPYTNRINFLLTLLNLFKNTLSFVRRN